MAARHKFVVILLSPLTCLLFIIDLLKPDQKPLFTYRRYFVNPANRQQAISIQIYSKKYYIFIW